MWVVIKRAIWRARLDWKTIVLLITISWAIRLTIEPIYCLALHLIIFRWTSCHSDHYWPMNFSDIDAVVSKKYALEPVPCENINDDPTTIAIVVLVPVHVSDLERRATVRESWATPFITGTNLNGMKLWTKFVFVVGGLIKDEGNTINQYELRKEFSKYNDILQLDDIIDDYYNITLKMHAALDWVIRRCPSVEYVVRADSDIVLNYWNMIRFLFWLKGNRRGSDSHSIVAGYCRHHDCITRWPGSKTCLPRFVYQTLLSDDFDSAYFVPRYCFGFSYVLSIDFLRKALLIWSRQIETTSTSEYEFHNRLTLHRYWPLDDMFLTGYLADELENYVLRLNHPRAFTYVTKFDSFTCHENGVVASAAYDDNEEMKRRWETWTRRCEVF